MRKKFFRKIVFLFMIVILANFVSAAWLDFGKAFDFGKKSMNFGIENWDNNVLWVIALIGIIIFMVIRRHSGRSRALREGKRGLIQGAIDAHKWITIDRKKENEAEAIREIGAMEASITRHQENLEYEAANIIQNIKDIGAYENSLRLWVPSLRQKIKGFRKTIASTLNSVLKNEEHSFGWMPHLIREGYLNPALVKSRLNEYFRNVVLFLRKNIKVLEHFKHFLVIMEQELSSIIQIEGRVRKYVTQAIAGDEQAKSAAQGMETKEVSQQKNIGRARRLWGFIRKQLGKTKGVIRVIKKQERLDMKIRRKSRKMEKLAKRIKGRIDSQNEALIVIGSIMVRIEDIYSFKSNAKQLEYQLGIFEVDIYDDIKKLQELDEEIKNLENEKGGRQQQQQALANQIKSSVRNEEQRAA